MDSDRAASEHLFRSVQLFSVSTVGTSQTLFAAFHLIELNLYRKPSVRGNRFDWLISSANQCTGRELAKEWKSSLKSMNSPISRCCSLYSTCVLCPSAIRNFQSCNFSIRSGFISCFICLKKYRRLPPCDMKSCLLSRRHRTNRKLAVGLWSLWCVQVQLTETPTLNSQAACSEPKQLKY